MAEPASGTLFGIMAGLGAAALLPFINGDALLGAAFGAALITSTKKDILWWQRLLGLVVSTLGGYLFGPEVLAQTPIKSMAAGACIASVACVPLTLKFSEWIERFDIGAALRDAGSKLSGWLKGGSGK
jgi:hypothetical protein